MQEPGATLTPIDGDRLATSIIQSHDIVDDIRKGRNDSTFLAIEYVNKDKLYRKSLLQQGLLDVVLGFLGRCNENFVSVVFVNNRNTKKDIISCPSVWVELLHGLSSTEVDSIQIGNIAPLVNFMFDDTERTFFGSKNYWYKSIQQFAPLIYNVMMHTGTNMLLQHHKALVERVTQWWFWESTRPDIIDESKSYVNHPQHFQTIMSKVGETLVCSLIGNVRGLLVTNDVVDGLNLLQTLGSIPIVSSAYDPTCKVSLVVGIIRRFKTSGRRDHLVTLLKELIVYAGCADKDVIIEMIDLGNSFTTNHESGFVLDIIRFIVSTVTEGGLPSDTRIACAIHAGSESRVYDCLSQ